MTLPAGDWAVSAGIDMYQMSGPALIGDTYWQVYLGPLRNNFADSDSDVDIAWFLWHIPGSNQIEFSMGVIRISSASPTTVILQCQVDGQPYGTPHQAGGIIRARRVR